MNHAFVIFEGDLRSIDNLEPKFHTSAMQCTSCKHLNVVGAKFCEQCGSALGLSCAACGHRLSPDARFCGGCGAPVPSTAAAGATTPVTARDSGQSFPAGGIGDRRQAAVLFADISGYTSLCARSDPEQVREMLGRFFHEMDKVVESFGGRVIDRAGDAVMAAFGAPVAHGNDAERALRAAFAMHAAAARLPDCEGLPLRLHIGVARGEVVAAVIAGGGKEKYSVTGEPVNLAARLDALAGAGETLISEALYREVAGGVDAESFGVRAIKGLAVPVAVWRALGLREARADLLPFVGRQAELRQLQGALEEVRSSGSGLTVLVRGDAGIGKSRLLEEFRQRARGLSFETPAGQVLDFGVGQGQGAVPTILRALLRVQPQADEPARRAALDAALARAWVREDELPFFNEWLELPQPKMLESMIVAMDNATRLQRSGEALAALLLRAASECPLLLLVEDIHWASPELLRQLATVARAAAGAPMILLLTSRIEGDPLDRAWRASIHGSAFMTIDLAPLRPQEARRLAGGLVEATSRFALLCIERAEGNPLFLEQLLRTARMEDTPGLMPGVPPTIQSLVLERIDRLTAPARAALQVAAVIGKRFSLIDLRGVGGDPAADCEVLMAADLVRPDGSDFLFSHALIQEAVYASTLRSRRHELHLAAARWFGVREPLLEAEHLDRAADAGAAGAYLRAATQEALRLRFESALRLAERGGVLAAGPTHADPRIGCELALLRGEVLREIGLSKDSIGACESALELASDELQQCRAAMGIAAGHRVTGDFEAAMAALARAEPIAERLGLTPERSRIHYTRGNLYFSQGRVAECDAEHAEALRHAEACGDIESQARALSGLGDSRYAQGRMASALEHFRRCVALSEAQIRIAVPNRCMIGHCLWYANRLHEAIDEARAACADAERFGVVSVQVFAHATMTQVLTEAGRFDDAAAAGEKALALARLAGSRRYEATLLSCTAEHKLRSGDLDAARADMSLAVSLSRQTGPGFIGAALQGRLARLAATAEERAACLAEGDALLANTGLAHNHLWFYRDAAEACLAARDVTRALGYAEALESMFAAEPLPWVELMVQRARAIAALQQDSGDAGARARLAQLLDTAATAGNGWVRAGMEQALAAA